MHKNLGFKKKHCCGAMGCKKWDVKTPTAWDFQYKKSAGFGGGKIYGVSNHGLVNFCWLKFQNVPFFKLPGAKNKKKHQPMCICRRSRSVHSKQLPGKPKKYPLQNQSGFTDSCRINQGSSQVDFFWGWKSMRIANGFVSNFGSRIHIRVPKTRHM